MELKLLKDKERDIKALEKDIARIKEDNNLAELEKALKAAKLSFQEICTAEYAAGHIEEDDYILQNIGTAKRIITNETFIDDFPEVAMEYASIPITKLEAHFANEYMEGNEDLSKSAALRLAKEFLENYSTPVVADKYTILHMDVGGL